MGTPHGKNLEGCLEGVMFGLDKGTTVRRGWRLRSQEVSILVGSGLSSEPGMKTCKVSPAPWPGSVLSLPEAASKGSAHRVMGLEGQEHRLTPSFCPSRPRDQSK